MHCRAEALKPALGHVVLRGPTKIGHSFNVCLFQERNATFGCALVLRLSCICLLSVSDIASRKAAQQRCQKCRALHGVQRACNLTHRSFCFASHCVCSCRFTVTVWPTSPKMRTELRCQLTEADRPILAPQLHQAHLCLPSSYAGQLLKHRLLGMGCA